MDNIGKGWNPPKQLRWWFENCMKPGVRWPGHKGVYVVTGKSWVAAPSERSDIWYVGTVKNDSGRLCTRVGDLIADMLGFFSDKNGHHSGGQSIFYLCDKLGIHPGDLWIGWKQWVHDASDTEKSIIAALNGTRCNVHHNPRPRREELMNKPV
jgi:hypothetical protein